MPSLTLDWLQLIALLGAIQGVFLTGVLASRRRNRTANRLLAVLTLALSLHLASAVYHAARLEPAFAHFFGVAYPVPLLYGPLVYLYAVTAADRTRRLTRRDALHLIPFVAVVLAGLPIYLLSGAEKIALYHQIQSGVRPLLLRIVDPLKLVSGVTYAAFTMMFLARHREHVKHNYSSIERVNLRWLLWIGAAAGFIWMLAVAFRVLESTDAMRIVRAEDFISLAIAILVYSIGYMGLRQPEIFRYVTAEYPAVVSPTVVAESEPEVELRSEPESGARYERSGLTERQAHRLKDALLSLMERERPWQESDLTLADLAGRLSTTPHKLSEVLNAQLGQTFYDFVNGYRVREVERRIAAGEAARLTMLSLALDAGFASKSTFNMVFKKHTNRTPSAYRHAAAAGQ